MPPVTCHLRYEIDPSKLQAFERLANRWIALVERSGGQHHSYFLPAEGASDVAYALFTFPSLAAYELYRHGFVQDAEFAAADRIREESGCVLRHERSFLRPLQKRAAGGVATHRRRGDGSRRASSARRVLDGA